MYRSSAQFRRTPTERADQRLSWNRDDVRFFAARACHIHRERQYFAFDPWERALRYLARFPTPEEQRAGR
jgi:hypothetical protein